MTLTTGMPQQGHTCDIRQIYISAYLWTDIHSAVSGLFHFAPVFLETPTQRMLVTIIYRNQTDSILFYHVACHSRGRVKTGQKILGKMWRRDPAKTLEKIPQNVAEKIRESSGGKIWENSGEKARKNFGKNISQKSLDKRSWVNPGKCWRKDPTKANQYSMIHNQPYDPMTFFVTFS